MTSPQTFDIAGRQCWRAAFGDGADTVVYFAGGQDERDALPEIRAIVMPQIEAGVCRPFMLAGFLSEDWNGEYSPWPADAIFKKTEPFGGGASATLGWLEASFAPELEARLDTPVKNRALAGYSLAGLFALWAMYNSDTFNMCASCSGSLWYPGWMEYVRRHTIHPLRRAYISLGEREEHTKNPVMRAVGDNTRAYFERLEQDASVEECALEWNEGGHFNDVATRLARALLWIMHTEK